MEEGMDRLVPIDIFNIIIEFVQSDLKVMVVLDNILVSCDFILFLKINIMPIIYERADRLRGVKNLQTESMGYVRIYF